MDRNATEKGKLLEKGGRKAKGPKGNYGSRLLKGEERWHCCDGSSPTPREDNA